MMKSQFLFVIALFFLTAALKAQTQVECNCITINKIEYLTNENTLKITFLNKCDQLLSLGYLDIFVIDSKNQDTLAKTNCSCVGPFNINKDITYSITNVTDFSKDIKFKIALAYSSSNQVAIVCDSLDYSNAQIITTLNDIGINKHKKLSIHNNKILLIDESKEIKEVSIYNMSGQLVEKKSGIFSSEYTLNPVKPGIYLVSVTLSNNEVVNLKFYYKTAKLH